MKTGTEFPKKFENVYGTLVEKKVATKHIFLIAERFRGNRTKIGA